MKQRHGASLVEILVVISILALVMQLLIPAVQASRESARKATCLNQLRAFGLAAQNHEAAKGHLPTGGWNWEWVGDPTRGHGKSQPGSWAYNLLPFLEAQAIHDYPQSQGGKQVIRLSTEMLSMVPGGFNCPSRRPSQAVHRMKRYTGVLKNSHFTSLAAKTDYAVNGGDVYVNLGPSPDSYEDARTFAWPEEKFATASGVVFVRSEIKLRKITDGLSKTYFVGEKYLNPTNYRNGEDVGDDQSLYHGDDSDVTRWTMATVTDEWYELFDHPNMPRQDNSGFFSAYAFGSAHASGWQVVMADGSARMQSYDLEPEVHRAFGNRHDSR